MISQIFIISPQRGDMLISHDYRYDIQQDVADLLLERIHSWHKEHGILDQGLPPAFNVDGVQILFTNVQGLYFACTTKFNVSPFMVYELLDRIVALIKEFCGVLSEESIRLNSSLVYELLNEVIDYGYPQTTITNQLINYVYEDQVSVKRENIITNSLAKLKSSGTILGSSGSKPITYGRLDNKNTRQNEVFVDIIERLVATFSSNVCDEDEHYGITLDDYKFHDSVDFTEREFIAMSYRVSGDFGLPFRVFPSISDISDDSNRIDVTIRVRADIPDNFIVNKCLVIIPVPRATLSVSNENLDGSIDQSAQYDNQLRKVIWTIVKFKGGTEQSIKIKITGIKSLSPVSLLEMGPISLEFDIPNYTCSNIQIHRLKVYENNNLSLPQRWVRYSTISESYIFRI
ncbi:19925_t:CDS:10 [Entrophospora sp. SA101]|nr:19925_t:CDS:10 [Entrophospora sp. SA101]